jgi:tetratricopeptide (TPR) repeat protein
MLALRGQTPDPAYGPLEKAYNALRARQYETAIVSFRLAVDAAPERASIRKDLAYAYLKIGQTELARDQFAEALRLDQQDAQAALEYAFLCHETGNTAEARRIFGRLRKTGDPESRATAERAFENIDAPLAEGIRRWSAALELSPAEFSAHLELARLAEKRDDLPLAAEHYEKAWRLRPELRSLLVDLGRVLKTMGATERANSALLAASRGAEPRAAESARDLLPSRYPYVYEFRQAIELDPGNDALRQELGFLLEAMRPREKAPPASVGADARTLADRSYRAGYLKDALKYYLAAQESDPLDFPVMLRLGWTYNILGQDKEAVRWFKLARKSPDTAIRSEAEKAYRNLSPPLARYRTTVWLYPMWSSRWKDMFSYGQVKTEMRLGRLPLRTYLSTRFVGDTRGVSSEASPQYLSESSIILGAGVATSYWHGFMLWAEAGNAINYSRSRAGRPRTAPDYRGGLTFSKGAGKLLGARSRGLFAETGGDAVFVSRFQNDVVMYLQNRFGYTLPAAASLGGLEAQFYWNANPASDIRRAYWANVVEFGPGVRFRWKAMPPSCVFSINLLRGAYTRNEGNPRGPNYYDVRVGIWYAVTR